MPCQERALRPGNAHAKSQETTKRLDVDDRVRASALRLGGAAPRSSDWAAVEDGTGVPWAAHRAGEPPAQREREGGPAKRGPGLHATSLWTCAVAPLGSKTRHVAGGGAQRDGDGGGDRA